MVIEPVELQGKHVRLLPLSEEHAEALFDAGQSKEIWYFMPTWITRLDTMQEWIEDALKEQKAGTALPFTIFDLQNERIVGSTRFLDIALPHKNLEIGWTWLNPEVWRTPINTECKYLLLSHCFETLGMIRVQLKTDARNLRSQRAIERLGAIKEGVLRHHRIMPDGYLRDTVIYSILADEWPEIKTRLETYLDNPPL